MARNVYECPSVHGIHASYHTSLLVQTVDWTELPDHLVTTADMDFLDKNIPFY